MLGPIAASRRRSGGGGGGPFDPTSLFASGEQGVIFDPTDLSTLFQDTSGTSAVTASGQAVARMNDISGNGNDVTQSNLANRPTYNVTSGKSSLVFVPGDSTSFSLPTALLSGWTSGTGMFGAKATADPATSLWGPVLGEFGGDTSANELYPYNGDGSIYATFLTSSRRQVNPHSNVGVWHTGEFRSATGSWIFAVNGSADSTLTGTTFATSSSPKIGRGEGISFSGNVGRIIIINRVLNSTELTNARAWIAAAYT